jgi:endonuclease/exonuclease/phosphatase family metal-dependent hydrolase
MPQMFSIAFYNLENLFDTECNEFTLDKDYTPKGSLEWTNDRYERKIKNLSNAISKIGIKNSQLPPVFLGIAEVENKTCLEDLIKAEKLYPFNYDYVHHDSPDERGLDVAFLYQKKLFELTYSTTYTLYLTDNQENRDYTRDILLISGKLFGEQIYIIVNHWPSRNNGTRNSDNKRLKAAKLVRKILVDIYKENEHSNVIIMGDFNDEPNDKSLKELLINNDLYNAMQPLSEKNKGTSKYHGKWFLFDQIIMSNRFLHAGHSRIKFKSVEIFDVHFLQERSNKRKGAPKRTYIGGWHQGGYSDHFPVLAYFSKTN